MVLLKNGTVCVGIEKERLSRIKHDGGNDTLAIQYCLDAEGITLDDIDLVVQCANFVIPSKDKFHGERLFNNRSHPKVINISHHLAHAYSAIGTSPFDECAVMVIDGCGSPLNQFLELNPDREKLLKDQVIEGHIMHCEKDSFYLYKNNELTPVWKDFSEFEIPNENQIRLPTTKHSIGGFYAAISHYVFGDMNDVGKLMGLAPFGRPGVYHQNAFYFDDSDRLMVTDEWKSHFNKPSLNYKYFKTNFQYYADVARWAQEEVEKAVLHCVDSRLERFPHKNLCYSGGVALNVAANRKLLQNPKIKELYIEPAAADNGLALGCAYYGWLGYLKQSKVQHNGDTCFGKTYSDKEILESLKSFQTENYQFFNNRTDFIKEVANHLNNGKTIAWFQGGAEFGPRALGRRSILANPSIPGIKDHINRNIKFREDFRPFAPAVLKSEVKKYFVEGWDSPYMLLLDLVKKDYFEDLKNVCHLNRSARVQTVDRDWNESFFELLNSFYQKSGIPILLNTSLNKKGTPIVETPTEALSLFEETALDILAIGNFIVNK